MNKLTSITLRIWFITMLTIGFCFITTVYFYDLLYQNRMKENYTENFSHVMENLESLLDSDPQFLMENLERIPILYPDIQVVIDFDGRQFETSSFSNEKSKEEFSRIVVEEPAIAEAIEAGEDTQITTAFESGNGVTTPYVFRSKTFTDSGQEGVMYAFGEMTFIAGIMYELNQWALVFFVLYGIFAVLFFNYLQKKLGNPLVALRDIAFDYAKNDFSRQAPFHSQDELSQLALAMNKMGKSLETTGTATRQEKELLENIVSSISTGILYYNQDKTLLMSNPIGDDFLQNYYEENTGDANNVPEIVEKKIDHIIEKPEKIVYDATINDFYFEITLVPLFDKDLENVRGILVSLQDLTKERRLDTMRVSFINNVSHELRTPLVMIQGYSEAILDDIAETNEEKHEMARIIGDESRRMNRMVNEMLDLSRMEAGYIHLSKQNVNLEVFFSQLLSKFSTMAQKANVVLALNIDPGLEYYPMDEDKMNQVFVNILNNAIRHTKMAEREQGKITISVHLDKIMDEVLIEVVDNGTGIPEEDLPYIFDRFYKVDKSRKMDKINQSGTGIGLAIVKNIVKEHDGYIEVESIENEFTTFTMHFPYIAADEEAD